MMSDRKGHNGITQDGTATTLTAQEKERALVGTSVVRRLTPLECERLQGFPDNWSKYGINEKGEVYELSDSARYKLQGNSIARPFWTWLLRRIAAQYERPATLGSLFDGQAGFPLCWKEVGGIPVWSSEIEKNAVAVAKYHFPEDDDDTDFIREYGWMEDDDVEYGNERMQKMNLHKRIQMLEGEISDLRSRCYPGAEKYFDSKQYGLLKIVTIREEVPGG